MGIKQVIYQQMLVLAGRNLSNFGGITIEDASKVTYLDISSNEFTSGAHLKPFVNLRILIVDNNNFDSLHDFPSLPLLETFSANKNQFSDLDTFLASASAKFPTLQHLSLVRNPCCPMFVSEEAYEIYTIKVLRKLKDIVNLDGVSIPTKMKEKILATLAPAKSAKPAQPAGKPGDPPARKKISMLLEGEAEAAGEEEKDEEGVEDARERKVTGVLEYNEKYEKKRAKKTNNVLKTNSEGNKYVKNDQL
eukprot:TRINITY_DN1256_c0_g1_i1.p1 TRINITY_DN1256_c0_g1~~TRINITY_DN1256_c0_g1_i1.p1  ORF type:complete len:249 (+),score=73.60 TRINITY_DN1256_c0_g1_i1:95-841(+)